MMNRKGFTLADVLITLGIIGVVASLTIPPLVQSTNKKTMGNALARSVELIQQGFTNIKVEAQKNSADDTVFENLAMIKKSDLGLDGEAYITDDNSFYNDTRSFLGTEESNYNINSIKNFSGSDVANNLLQDFTAYKFNKANMVVMFQNVTNNDIVNADNDTIISKVLIDANGVAGPNRFGKDVFLFGLTNAGTLIPAGTEQYNDFDNTIATGACSGASVGDGTACAARVMTDKWEVKY